MVQTFTIRREQMRALEEDAQKRALLAHVQEFLPAPCEDMGYKELKVAIERCMNRAAAYGFSAYRDVEQFTMLSLTLGEGFEDRDEFAWTRGILNDRNPAHAPFRATWLYEKIVKQLG